MSVAIVLTCNGCSETAVGTGLIRRRLVSTYGGPIVHHVEQTPISDLTPDGWVMFDPYTQCTYCPDCWASIENGDPS